MKNAAVSVAILWAAASSALAQLLPPDFLMPIPPPRIELADTNSTPMQVQEMSVAAAVRGLYATVDTTLVFLNPNPRLLEGELVFPLPDGAAVCGYALDVNGVLVDGVVVKKEKARVAFEAETRRRVDPGLVEHVKGNLYRTRIYPLPARGTRTLRLSYTAPLALAPNGDAALLLPMPRTPIDQRSVRIEVADNSISPPELGGLGDLRFQQADRLWRVESTTTNAAPGEDIWVALPRLPPAFSSLEKSPDGSVWFSLSAMAPPFAEKTLPPPARFHVLWDASGSRAGANLQKDYDLLAALPADTPCSLVVFRDVPEPARDFATPADLLAALPKIPFDGGSDFAALAAALPSDGAPLLLFTDGIDTLSDQPLEFPGAKPMAIVSQTIADREALRQACSGALIDLATTDPKTGAARILAPAPRVAGLQGRDVARVQGLGRPANGRVTLLGQLTAPESTVQIEYADGTLSAPFLLRAAEAREGRTLATAWAAARVNQLSPRADAFADELLALGRQYGLVSPVTSLIVLESLDQWVRHEIEPPASLPDLREQYYAALKNRGQDAVDARTRHLQQLSELWKQRVEWWKTDFSKVPIPVATVPDEHVRRPDSAPSAPLMMRSEAPAPMVAGNPDEESMEETVFSAPAETDATLALDLPAASSAPPSQSTPDSPAAAIHIKEWSPDTPYLPAIRAAAAAERYAAYLAERPAWTQSPAFFLDCAGEILPNDPLLGRRILSNLAEMKIEDAALLRVFAWRLRQAGDLDRAIVLLRRIARLRAEEPQSFRDLALALAERGKATRGPADLEEAMDLLLKVALTPWGRHADTLPLFALEELNALVAWIGRQEWKEAARPVVPDYDEQLRDNLDTDLRIVMAWDADATDIDLHVVEPGGEEAFYGHNHTARGGLVSRDVTDGYGPEEYLVRAAPPGSYAIRAKYYGSRQQTLVGAATVTASVFTDWGRPGEKVQSLTLRLDQPRDMVDIGTVTFGTQPITVPAAATAAALRPGMTPDEVLAALGEPSSRQESLWIYSADARTLQARFGADGRLLRVVELLPGGIENIVVQ